MEKEGTDMEKLVYILCQEGYNKQGANLRQAGKHATPWSLE
jgi:hypothetical protein